MKRRGGVWLGLVVAMSLCALAPAPAGAAAAKQYSVTLTPQSVVSGQRSTLSATIRNISVSSIGSANMTAPAGFRLVSASVPGATATIVGNTAQLRGLNIPRGSSKVATLIVDPPCSPVANAAWTAVAKPPADFKGAALSPQGGPITTSTTGSCSLGFTTSPADVEVFQTITGTAGDPSGPPVAIILLDGAGQPVTGPPVSVVLGAAPAGAVLGGTTTASTSGGSATFDTLTVDEPGTYTLVASAAGISTTSAPFRADQGLTMCTVGVFCTALATTTGTVPGSDPPVPYSNIVTVDAPDGGDEPLRISYNVGPDIACPGYVPVSPDREVFSGPNGAKTVRSSIAGVLLAAQDRSSDSLRTCIVTPYPFLVSPSEEVGATPIGDIDGDGNPDFRGVLPYCSETDGVAPCQVSVTVDESGNAIVEYILPPSDLDPISRH